jgi:hypothetical protein
MGLRRFGLGFLLFALLAAQTLGLLHRVVHFPHATASLQPTSESRSWAPSLFAAHGDDASCRLFDQLTHGDAAPALAVTAPALVAAFFLLPFFQGEALARWATLFDARGPPLPR